MLDRVVEELSRVVEIAPWGERTEAVRFSQHHRQGFILTWEFFPLILYTMCLPFFCPPTQFSGPAPGTWCGGGSL